MGAIVLVAPFSIDLISISIDGILRFRIYSLIWIHESNLLPVLIFHPFAIINNAPTSVLRFLFVFEMVRAYQRIVPRRRAIFVGVIAECWQLCLMVYFNIFLRTFLTPAFSLYMTPIPLLLIVGLIFLILAPPPRPIEQWNEDLKPHLE